MLIQGENSQFYIKIHVDKEDGIGVRFTVETQSRGFPATVGGIYNFTEDMTNFVSALQILEDKRRSEVRLQFETPEEVDMVVRTIDRADHAMVSLGVQDWCYEAGIPPCSLEVAFGIDPTTLQTLLYDFERLERDA